MKGGEVLDRVCDRVFWIGLLGSVGFVLWLPLFPSGDGPVHLYYADVLASLLQHQTLYAQDYAVRHLFAPYLVHYLALISLEQIASPPLAEKLFIVVIFFSVATGFRFLARTLGEHAGLACVWMLPLLFSWSLGGGFLNCCFATGVALWAFGAWARLSRAGSAARAGTLLLTYGVLLSVLVLSHPVPLMVLLLFTCADLLLRVAAHGPGHAAAARNLPWLVAAFLLSCCAFVAPVLLAQKGQAAAILPAIGFHADVLIELVSGSRLGYFSGLDVHSAAGWCSLALRVLLVAIVPGVAALLLWNKGLFTSLASKHSRAPLRWLPGSEAGRLLLISLTFLACTIFFPRSLNHSYFFPQRLWDIVWLLVLACGAATVLSSTTQRWLAATGVLAALLTAATGLPALAGIAQAQQQLAIAQLPAGERGLLVEPESAVSGRGAATTYPVWFWAGARAFAASHAVLLNSPWLGLTILPIQNAASSGGTQPLLDRGMPPVLSESPVKLEEALKAGGDVQQTILGRADFLLLVNPARLPTTASVEGTGRAALALLRNMDQPWQCDVKSFYAVCTHAREK